MKMRNELIILMKKTTCTVICLTALALASAFCQQAPAPATPAQPPRPPIPGPGPVMAPAPAPAQPDFSSRLQNIVRRASEPEPAPVLTTFDLDFPGGTPKELVTAIEKAWRRPLNAIVPEELAATKLPAFKMNNVNVSQLFSALSLASRKTEASGNTVLFGYPAQTYQSAYGFKTEGKPSDDSIWYFFVDKPVVPPPSQPARPPKVCHFYALAPYLDNGLSVDDITTAIETAWKMLGDTSPPTISFHKDTKLLIAVGEPSKLETIDAVLKALEPPKPNPFGLGGYPYAPAAPAAKPAEKPKSEK
jgi:hypothetical protein